MNETKRNCEQLAANVNRCYTNIISQWGGVSMYPHKNKSKRELGNMLSAEELYFVNEYIVSNRRERIGWEINLNRKRADCIWRFAHCARDFLKPTLVHPVQIRDGELVLQGKSFRRKIENSQVFIMHPSEKWDRAIMDFQKALDDYLGSGPYVMIDLNHTFVFIETESGCDTHEFLYMHK